MFDRHPGETNSRFDEAAFQARLREVGLEIPKEQWDEALAGVHRLRRAVQLLHVFCASLKSTSSERGNRP